MNDMSIGWCCIREGIGSIIFKYVVRRLYIYPAIEILAGYGSYEPFR